MVKPKRLFFDIEVSPDIGFFWGAGYKLNIGYENIIKERAIICICYKWAGEKKVSSLTWDSRQCDKKLLQAFVKIANSADELVGHNGDKFDLAWIRTRCLFHRVEMFPSYTTVDTLKAARSKFRFNSNRLDYIAKFLGIGQKIKTEFSLWKDIVLNKCDKCMSKMVKYCKGDVELLERVYDAMSVHLPAKQHYGVKYHSGGKSSCPECGGKTKKNRRTVSPSGYIKQQYQCKECGKFHTTNVKK